MDTPSRRDFVVSSTLMAWLWGNGRLPAAFADAPKKEKPKSIFLEGMFAPVREEITAEKLKVVGKLPAEMDGLFVRNGPNPQFDPKGNYHLFDGDGMLHGVRVRDGKASYRNRYVRTKGWQEENRAGEAVYPGTLDPIDAGKMMKRWLETGEPFKNTANTALVWHHGKLLALWEGGPPHEIRVPNLETVGKYTFGGMLKHPFTAHPKVDPATGEMMCFGYQPMPPYVQYSVITPEGKVARTTPIKLPRCVMMHDFAITANYSVFMDLPFTIDIGRTLTGGPLTRFEPKHGARIGVLPRHGKGEEIKWFDVKTCFVFHLFNAYEEGDEVVLHACRMEKYPDWVSFDQQATKYEDAQPKETSPFLYRWRFNLKTGQTREEQLDDAPTEFPRINDARTGTATRFGYAYWMSKDESGFYKYDLSTGKSVRYSHGKGRFCGEGVFVPRPEAKDEDDGWLVSFVHDQKDNRGEMVVLDAQDFTKPAVARVLIPQRIPFGFHGLWVPGSAMGETKQ